MKHIKTHLGVLLFIGFFVFSGLNAPIQKFLTDLHFNYLSQEATGEVVLVAIDQKSIHEISQWPWQRSLHTTLIYNLKQAGAKEIAFDLDFSAATNPLDDGAFKDALSQANNSIILSSSEEQNKSSGYISVIHRKPLKQFYEHSRQSTSDVTFLKNRSVETMSYGHVKNDHFIPSLAAILSENYKPKAKDFNIDFSIKASTVPTFSYTDIIHNRINANLLKNKKIIVGLTVASLREHISIPSQGFIAAPMLQVLATETLIQNHQLKKSHPTTAIFAIILIACMVILLVGKASLIDTFYLFIITSFLIESLAIFSQKFTNVIIETSLWHITLIAYFLMAIIHKLDLTSMLTSLMKANLANDKKMFEQVFIDSFTGTILADQNGVIKAANKTSRTLLQLDNDSTLIGIHYHNIIPTEVVIAADQLLSQAGKNQSSSHYACQSKITAANGDQLTLEFILTLSKLASIDQYQKDQQYIISFSFKDVTARHKAELSQKKAIDAANQANTAKNEFLSTISHELRTPLNAIIGFSDIIKNSDQSKESCANNIDFAGVIKDSGQQLLKIINDIITLSKIESNSLIINTQQCDPIEMIELAIENVSQTFKEDHLNLVLEHKDNLPDLNVDQAICQEIITELLSNAIKFSPQESEINVNIMKTKSGELRITIQDMGTGISRQEIDNIFNPFYQIESSIDRHSEGTGLGLTKANAYIKLHGGTLKVDSTLGHGTTMYLTFPHNRIIEHTPSVVSINQPVRKIA